MHDRGPGSHRRTHRWDEWILAIAPGIALVKGFSLGDLGGERPAARCAS